MEQSSPRPSPVASVLVSAQYAPGAVPTSGDSGLVMEELPRSSPKAPAVSVPVSVPVQSITVSAAPTTVTVSAPPVTVPVLLPCLPLLLLLPVCFSCYCYRTCSCFMISYRFFCYCYRICSRYSYCACSHHSFVDRSCLPGACCSFYCFQ